MVLNPPSGRRALPKAAVSSLTWPLCLLSLPPKDFNVGDEVTPVDVKAGAETALVEALEKM